MFALTLISAFLLIVCLARLIYILAKSLRADLQNRKNNNAPYVETYARHYKRMKECLKPYLTPQQKLYDLGCGDGGALRFFAKEFGMKNLVGYDLHAVAVGRGNICNKVTKKNYILLHQQNFLEANIEQADSIYLFLLSPQLDSIRDWLQKKMRDDALIIVNTFVFSDREPTHIHISPDGRSVVRIYRKPTY